jgi:hypothetical protein
MPAADPDVGYLVVVHGLVGKSAADAERRSGLLYRQR